MHPSVSIHTHRTIDPRSYYPAATDNNRPNDAPRSTLSSDVPLDNRSIRKMKKADRKKDPIAGEENYRPRNRTEADGGRLWWIETAEAREKRKKRFVERREDEKKKREAVQKAIGAVQRPSPFSVKTTSYSRGGRIT